MAQCCPAEERYSLGRATADPTAACLCYPKAAPKRRNYRLPCCDTATAECAAPQPPPERAEPPPKRPGGDPPDWPACRPLPRRSYAPQTSLQSGRSCCAPCTERGPDSPQTPATPSTLGHSRAP